MTQLVTRVDDELLAMVDELIAHGEVANRSEAVREGLRRLTDAARRARVSEQIAAAYRTTPQGDDEGDWSDAASIAMIAEEPW